MAEALHQDLVATHKPQDDPGGRRSRPAHNDWTNSLRSRRLIDGDLTASVKFECRPNKRLNLRPLITVKGEIKEWQLMVSDPPEIDWGAFSTGPEPTPGAPVLTPLAIRFHPADIEVPIDLLGELTEFRTKYQELRFRRDTPGQYPLEPPTGSSNNLESTSST
jgi:hypothetical protein